MIFPIANLRIVLVAVLAVALIVNGLFQGNQAHVLIDHRGSTVAASTDDVAHGHRHDADDETSLDVRLVDSDNAKAEHGGAHHHV